MHQHPASVTSWYASCMYHIATSMDTSTAVCGAVSPSGHLVLVLEPCSASSAAAVPVEQSVELGKRICRQQDVLPQGRPQALQEGEAYPGHICPPVLSWLLVQGSKDCTAACSIKQLSPWVVCSFTGIIYEVQRDQAHSGPCQMTRLHDLMLA